MFRDLLESLAQDITREIVEAQNQIALIDRLLESDEIPQREKLALQVDRAVLRMELYDHRVSLNVVKENIVPTRHSGHEA